MNKLYLAAAEHVGRLTAALGKHDDFMPILGELKDMPREHLVAVANGFNGPMAPRTSKTKAIERIYSRHRKLMEFTNNPYDAS
jgi:hypothetical protein